MLSFVSQLPHLLAADCTGQTILPDIYDGLRTGCEVKIDSLGDVMVLAGNAIGLLMLIAGFVAIGFIIVGGFTYITSSGDPSGIKKAKDTITNAVIGLVIAMLAFGIVRYITGSF
jgi:hypothetical protein